MSVVVELYEREKIPVAKPIVVVGRRFRRVMSIEVIWQKLVPEKTRGLRHHQSSRLENAKNDAMLLVDFETMISLMLVTMVCTTIPCNPERFPVA